MKDSHFIENHPMDSMLGLRFIGKIDQRQKYLKASFTESVEQTKPGGFWRLSDENSVTELH